MAIGSNTVGSQPVASNSVVSGLIPVFNPPFPPLEPLEDQTQSRQITAQFGDGYSQVTGDGLNIEQSNVQLTFAPLSVSQYQVIDSFLNTNSGGTFYYALPTDGVTRIWSCSQWTGTRVDTHYSLQMTIVQMFPLGG